MGGMQDETRPGTLRGWWRRVSRPWPMPAFTVPGDHGVELDGVGERTVEVVRAIRQITGWSLMSATRATESTPVILIIGVSQGSAEAARRVLAEAGATSRVVRTVDV